MDSPIDVTDALFNPSELSTLTGLGITTTVKAMSDVEAAVPEPATLLLVGLGLVGLAGFKKRFRTN